ncbi:MAG: insulinase family protein [Uliginosibacterium sp.]|nr:insulinase family protein [Uliginosibacterium sp.]
MPAAAQFNGSTFFDRTNYHETFAASEDKLDWALLDEADRMVNSFIARADLDSEMSVVHNEMESGENDPGGILLAADDDATATSGTTTARAPSRPAGCREREDRKTSAFYRTYYRSPITPVPVVAGNFDETRALARITEYFAPFRPRHGAAADLYRATGAGWRARSQRQPGGGHAACWARCTTFPPGSLR